MNDNLVKRLLDRGVCSLEHNSCRNDMVCEQAADRIEELETKLAKAVKLAEKSIKWLRLYGADVHREAATLAELTGGKDEHPAPR
jgi:hypothetical protein